MFPAVLAIVTTLPELAIFLTVYWRPGAPTALGSVTVNRAEVASARRTESVAVRVSSALIARTLMSYSSLRASAYVCGG